MSAPMHALDALGSPIRRDILLALKDRPLAVGELAERFPVSRPAISRHLRVLEGAGLVVGTPEGARSLYSVRAEGFHAAMAFLDQFWDVALSRLVDLASKQTGEQAEEGRARGRPKGRR